MKPPTALTCTISAKCQSTMLLRPSTISSWPGDMSFSPASGSKPSAQKTGQNSASGRASIISRRQGVRDELISSRSGAHLPPRAATSRICQKHYI